MIDRMVGAARLDVDTYENVERDVRATGQAATVVLIAAVAGGIGNLREGGILGLVGGIVAGVVGWVLWSAITYWVGKTFFKTENTDVSLGQMLRTIGFAQSPGVLNVVGFVPVLGPLVSFIVGIWILVAVVIAIRQAMDFSTGRAIGTALVGFIPFIILFGIVGALVYA